MKLARHDGDLRLVDNVNNHINVSSGRLEVYVDGVWGTVCNIAFDILDANIACRELGYLGYAAVNTAPNLG